MPLLKHNRGYTLIETDAFTAFGRTRLFETADAARRALKCWLKGAWELDYETDDWGGNRYKIGASAPAAAPANRKADEMELVEFEVTEK